MSKPTTNGDLPHIDSATLSHITSYPLVSDSIDIYQRNPLGAKSISLAQQLYITFGEPIVPYLRTPYSYVSPYLQKADSLGDSGLQKIDSHFPALKTTDMEKLKSDAYSVAHYPFKVAGEGKDYVFNTYNDEYRKTGGDGIITTGKAIVSTELKIASDGLHLVAEYIGPKKDEAKAQLESLKKTGQEKLNQTKKTAQQQKDQAVHSAQHQKEQMVNSH